MRGGRERARHLLHHAHAAVRYARFSFPLFFFPPPARFLLSQAIFIHFPGTRYTIGLMRINKKAENKHTSTRGGGLIGLGFSILGGNKTEEKKHTNRRRIQRLRGERPIFNFNFTADGWVGGEDLMGSKAAARVLCLRSLVCRDSPEGSL